MNNSKENWFIAEIYVIGKFHITMYINNWTKKIKPQLGEFWIHWTTRTNFSGEIIISTILRIIFLIFDVWHGNNVKVIILVNKVNYLFASYSSIPQFWTTVKFSTLSHSCVKKVKFKICIYTIGGVQILKVPSLGTMYDDVEHSYFFGQLSQYIFISLNLVKWLIIRFHWKYTLKSKKINAQK